MATDLLQDTQAGLIARSGALTPFNWVQLLEYLHPVLGRRMCENVYGNMKRLLAELEHRGLADDPHVLSVIVKQFPRDMHHVIGTLHKQAPLKIPDDWLPEIANVIEILGWSIRGRKLARNLGLTEEDVLRLEREYSSESDLLKGTLIIFQHLNRHHSSEQLQTMLCNALQDAQLLRLANRLRRSN